MEVVYTADTPSQVKESEHSLQLLTENTTNGKKVQILLEELHEIYGISWSTHLVDLETDEQKKSWFLRLNPNGRIPVLLDVTDDGSVISIFESSAILSYLQETHDLRNVFGFESTPERSQALQWLFFWHSSGPVQGHTRHFVKGAPEPTPCKCTHLPSCSSQSERCAKSCGLIGRYRRSGILSKSHASHIRRPRSAPQRTT